MNLCDFMDDEAICVVLSMKLAGFHGWMASPSMNLRDFMDDEAVCVVLSMNLAVFMYEWLRRP